MNPKQRPAEATAGAAAALAVLICALLDVDDPNIYGALVIVIGLIPALVTWIVTLTRGGDDPSPARSTPRSRTPPSTKT